jgi:hypothetical protein
MTVTYEKLQSWKPDGLSDAADKLNNLRKKLIDEQDEMDAGKPPGTWQSDSAQAARDRHKRLVQDINDIAAPLSAVVAGLDSAASSLRSAKESAKTAYDGAVGKGWKVTFPGGTQVEIEDPTPPESKAPGNRRGTPSGHPDQGTMDSYAETISKALADATEAETELQGVLNTATSGGYDGGDGEIADAIPPEIGKILAAGQEDGDKPDKAAMQRYAAYMDELEDEPELKREIMSQMGREGIANAFKNAEATGVDLHAAMGATGRGVIEDWVEHDVKNKGVSGDTATLLDAYKKDAAFTKELFTNVTPDQWADAIKHENDEAFHNGKIDEADRKVYGDFLRAGGSAFATYTQGHPDPTGLASEWFKSITEGDDENASALTLMIKKGGEDGATFQTDFMYNLTDDVYNWEKSHDGDPVWGPKSAGLLDPDAEEISAGARGRGAYEWTKGLADDGMANLLGGMAHSPEAAQQFFKDGTLDNGDEDDRFKYFMLDRTFAASDGSDEGDGFGLALEAATVGSLEHGDREFANDLTDRVFKTVAENSGRGDDAWFLDGEWHTWPEFNDSLGAIASGYKDDVYDVMKGAGGNDLDVTMKDMEIVLGEMGRGEDKSGVEMLSASLVQEGNHRVEAELQDYLKEHPNATLEQVSRDIGGKLSAVTTETGDVLGKTLGYSVLVDLEDEAREQAKAEFMQKAISIGSGFIPGGGDIIGESLQGASKHFAGAAIDTATSEGIDALKNAVGTTPPASDWIAQQEDSGAQLLKRNLMNTYLDSGVIPEKAVEGLTVETPEGRMFRPDIYQADDINKIEGLTEQERENLKTAWREWSNSDPAKYFTYLSTDGLQQFDQRLEDTAEDAKEVADMSHEDRQKWRKE